MRRPSVPVSLNQPALKVVTAFGAGIVSTEAFALSIGVAFIVVASFFLLAFLFRLRTGESTTTSWRSLLLYPLVFLCGLFWSSLRWEGIYRTVTSYADISDRVVLAGIVEEEPRGDQHVKRFVLRSLFLVHDSAKAPVEGSVLVTQRTDARDTLDRPLDLRCGDVVLAAGMLRVPRGKRNPGDFDYRTYLLAHDIVATMTVTHTADIARTEAADRSYAIGAMLNDARTAIRRRIAQLFSPTHAVFLTGLLLGDRTAMDTEVISDFSRAGVIHVLSVSGLHVGMIYLIIVSLLGRLRRSRRALVVVPLLLLYMVLTGSEPPVARSVIMMIVFLGGDVLQRKSSTINSICFAAIVILILQPLNIFLVGFQLSFGAIFSLAIIYDRLRATSEALVVASRKNHITRGVSGIVLMTIAAQLGTMPILLFHFGNISVISLLANVAIIPLIFLITAGAIVALCVSLLALWLGFLAAATVDLTLAATLWLVHIFASVPFAIIEVARPGIFLSASMGAAVLYIFMSPRRALRFRIAFVGLVCTNVLFYSSITSRFFHSRDLTLTMLDVGQGDALAIETPSGKNYLLDAGQLTEYTDAGKRFLLPFYKSRGIEELDGVLLTHADNDHVGGVVAVLDAMRVHALYRTAEWKSTGTTRMIDSLMRVKRLRSRHLHRGNMLSLDRDVRLYVLHPSERAVHAERSANASSLVLLLVYGKTKMLLTGDAEAEGEQEMISAFSRLLDADVLKVGHHGSATCSSPQFLARVSPSIALISCGRKNKFGHPARVVLERLRVAGAFVHRTDLNAACVLASDGERVRLIDWR